MPMRTDCRHYESRTYPSGDTVRKCDLDLAPEAPWRCPEDCPRYEPRSIDFGWQHGPFVPDGGHVPEPPSVGEDESVASLLDAAEEILNEAGPRVLAEVEQERARQGGFLGRLRRFGRRKHR